MTETGSPTFPTIAEILRSRESLKGVAQQTPLDFSKTFSDMAQNNIFLKLENLQKTGSFKLRGAYNKIHKLTEEECARGVIAASAGNHAQGVAYAAALHHAPCTIVMPEGASLAKISATQHYGAEVVLAGSTYDDAYAHAIQLQQQYGYTYVHAFDDADIIAGQGTVGLEILEQQPKVDAVVVPMGGGGLAAGIGIALKSIRPDIQVIGVEAANIACFHHSMKVGHIDTVPGSPTIADGIAVKRPGELTYAIAQKYVDEVITVEEVEIARAMVLLMERSKLVAEGAASSALAACIYKKLSIQNENVVVILSGGNVDVSVLSRIIEHGLVEAGRYLRLAVTLADRPGALRDLLDIFARLRANVVSVDHHRHGTSISYGQTEVEIDLETRDAKHIDLIVEELQKRGYHPVIRS